MLAFMQTLSLSMSRIKDLSVNIVNELDICNHVFMFML